MAQVKLTEAILHDVVDDVPADQKSVLRRALGLPVRGRIAARIDRALADRGVVPPSNENVNAAKHESADG